MRQGGNGVAGQHGGMSWMKRRRKRREERGAGRHDLTVIHTQNPQVQPKYVYCTQVTCMALLLCLHHVQYWIASSTCIHVCCKPSVQPLRCCIHCTISRPQQIVLFCRSCVESTCTKTVGGLVPAKLLVAKTTQQVVYIFLGRSTFERC